MSTKTFVSPTVWASSLFKRKNPLAHKRPISQPVVLETESLTHLRLLPEKTDRKKEGMEARRILERNAQHLYVRWQGLTKKVNRIVFESENGEDRFSQTFSYYPFKMTVMTEEQCFDYVT